MAGGLREWMGPSGFEPESPAPQAGRISCGWDGHGGPPASKPSYPTDPRTGRTAGRLKTFAVRRAQRNGRTSSISSTFARIIRRQQYRVSPTSSSTADGGSPARVRFTNVSNELATTFPQVKHRTGMIIGSPIRLLTFLPGASAKRVLRQLPSRVGHDEGAVVLAEEGLEFLVVQVTHEAAGDRGARRVCLPHDSTAPHVDLDVDGLRLLPREFERFEDLHPGEFERIYLHRDAVDPDRTPALPDRSPRHGCLAFSTRHEDLHGII